LCGFYSSQSKLRKTKKEDILQTLEPKALKISEEYRAKVAKTEKQICQLVEAGFEYMCDFEDGKSFRKRN